MSEAVSGKPGRRGAWVRDIDDESYLPTWRYTACPERYRGVTRGGASVDAMFEVPPHMEARSDD